MLPFCDLLVRDEPAFLRLVNDPAALARLGFLVFPSPVWEEGPRAKDVARASSDPDVVRATFDGLNGVLIGVAVRTADGRMVCQRIVPEHPSQQTAGLLDDITADGAHLPGLSRRLAAFLRGARVRRVE